MSALCSALCSVLCSVERLNKLFISSSVMWLNAAFPARQIYLTKCFLLNYLLGTQRKLLFEGLFLFAIDWLLWEIRSIRIANHLQQLIYIVWNIFWSAPRWFYNYDRFGFVYHMFPININSCVPGRRYISFYKVLLLRSWVISFLI